MTRRIIAALAAFLFAAPFLFATPALCAEPDLPSPPPADWMEQAQLYGRVATLGPTHDGAVVAWEEDHQRALSSGFLFDLSRRLLALGEAERALEWYAVALIRGQYDAARCRDATARRAVSGLARQAAPVARYGQAHPAEFAAAGRRALARSDLFAHTIAPDWVCAQALSGMGGQSAGTLPPERWPAAEASVRAEYGRQFEAMAAR
ncbi:hypothetical protein [Magnetospirillum sp. UT-4]|uniref:hypothetical protein n=1 Tax=Magnetospirillum sp. UT-4 TaxID=2681467 RepID=UPI001380AA71|nr:hypothetical protein [Magnetospirillum sp. UT-4]CAA7612187.1 Secreted protein [Magnetospirillum sp. UT-4]